MSVFSKFYLTPKFIPYEQINEHEREAMMEIDRHTPWEEFSREKISRSEYCLFGDASYYRERGDTYLKRETFGELMRL